MNDPLPSGETGQRLSHGAEGPGEEHERLADRREARFVHAADDDPVIAGRMLGDELAFEVGEGVGEERDAGAAQRPLDARRSGPRPAGSPAWRSASWLRARTLTPKCRAGACGTT